MGRKEPEYYPVSQAKQFLMLVFIKYGTAEAHESRFGIGLTLVVVVVSEIVYPRKTDRGAEGAFRNAPLSNSVYGKH